MPPLHRPLSLALLLLLLLLTGALASTQLPQLSTVRALQSELSSSASAAACLRRRTRAIARATEQLSAARDCRYAGLSPSAYLARRAICKTRSESRLALSRCTSRRSNCAKQRAALQAALRACARIRWDGSGARAECPRIDPANDRLARARARQCPAPGRPLPEIRQELAAAAEAARIALRLPDPPYPSLVVEPANETPDAVVFLLHGVGGRAEDTRELALTAKRSGLLPGVRFVLPQAPVQFVTFLNSTIPSWFDLLSNTEDGPQAVDEIIEAAGNIDALMDIQRKVYGIDPARVLVFGISQGGGLAATVYLRHRVGAAALFSGFLPIADTYPAALNDASKDAPLIMFHGVEDTVVPFSLAKRSATVMKALGRDVTFVEFPDEAHAFSDAAASEALQQATLFSAKALGL